MKTKILTLMSAILLFSCGGPFLLEKGEVLNNADMSSYKTFMMQTPEEKSIPDRMSFIDVQNLYKAVVLQMIDRGYMLVNANPDLIVNLAVSVQEKIETKDLIPPGTGVGYRYFGRRGAYAHSYYSDAQIISDIRTEGLLLMDIIDVKMERHVFFAEISTVKRDQFKSLESLDYAVRLLFKNYPVKLPASVEY